MIYFNQGATTWPKPKCVQEAVQAAIALPPFAQNRAGSAKGEDVLTLCRERLCQLFHGEEKNRIYFTSGATDSFQRVIRGLELDGKKVLVTTNEHNSVLRPLYQLCPRAEIVPISCDSTGTLLYEELEAALDERVSAVFVNHCSNVTGQVADLERIGTLVQQAGARFVVDASQSAGHLEIDVQKQHISILVFTGHKGLFGPQGTGGYYVAPGVSLKPTVFGGTGYDSKRLVMNPEYPEYEVGTQNSHGIAGLAAGVAYVQQQGITAIAKKEQALVCRLRQGLERLQGIELYGNGVSGGPVVSFRMQNWRPADLAYVLANGYEIIVRSGFCCAPWIHEDLGCAESGVVRVSLSSMNTVGEIDTFLQVIQELENSI